MLAVRAPGRARSCMTLYPRGRWARATPEASSAARPSCLMATCLAVGESVPTTLARVARIGSARPFPRRVVARSQRRAARRGRSGGGGVVTLRGWAPLSRWTHQAK